MPSPSPWQIDAATRQGQVRSENQDALSVIKFDDGTAVLIVCDGAGGVGGKGIAYGVLWLFLCVG